MIAQQRFRKHSIYVWAGGFSFSSSSYLLGACKRVLDKAGVHNNCCGGAYTTSGGLLLSEADQKGIPRWNHYLVEDAMEKFNLLGVHEDLLTLYNSPAWSYFDKVLYVHRDVRDSTVGIIKYNSISGEDDYEKKKEAFLKHRVLEGLLFPERLPQLWNMHASDMKDYAPYILDFTIGWRRHIIDFLRVKEMDNRVYEFRFEERKKNEKKDIEKIIDILKVNVDAEEVYRELKKELNTGGYANNTNTKKFGAYKTFFNEDEIRLMNLVAGDALSVMQYMELGEYSPFIAENDSFHIISFGEPASFVEDTAYLLSKLGKKIESIIHTDRESFQSFKVTNGAKYLIFSQNMSDLSLMTEKNMVENKDFILYPYYEVYRSYPIKVFNIKNRSSVLLCDLLQGYDTVYVIHDGSDFSINMVLQTILYRKRNSVKTFQLFSPEKDRILESLLKVLEQVRGHRPLILLSIRNLKLAAECTVLLTLLCDEFYSIVPMFDLGRENPYLKKFKELYGNLDEFGVKDISPFKDIIALYFGEEWKDLNINTLRYQPGLLHTMIGWFYFREGNFIKSIEQFTKGTISTAEALAVNGETEKALSAFSKLLDVIEDVRGVLLNNIAVIHLQQGRLELAKWLFGEVKRWGYQVEGLEENLKALQEALKIKEAEYNTGGETHG